jgi:hypothetical protein
LLNLRLSQITLALADNASRVGVVVSTPQQLREIDVDDISRRPDIRAPAST